MTCIIVEDEPLAQERLQSYISKANLDLIFLTDNGKDALEFLQKNQPDLIFLDINMAGISGIDLLEISNPDAEIIITTAYDEFAVKGFELNVTDYLLKPFSLDRFLQAVEKARLGILSQSRSKEKPFLFVKTEYRLEKIYFKDLLYIEGMRDYRKLITNSKPVMTLQTFRDFEKEVHAETLCRVHKSFMVCIEQIDKIEKNEIIIQGRRIPVSETYKEHFFTIISGKVK